MIDFDTFKQQIRKAAHENHSCVDGYRAMMAAQSYTQMLRVMYNNWDWVYNGGFYEVFCQYFGQWFDGHESDFHAADVYYNEPSDHGFVFVDKPDKRLSIGGQSKVFVLAPSVVDVCNRATVYCRADQSYITLHNSAYGVIKNGFCVGLDYSMAQAFGVYETRNHASVIIRDGICFDHGHELIHAYNSTVLGADDYHVELSEGSTLRLPDDNDKKMLSALLGNEKEK